MLHYQTEDNVMIIQVDLARQRLPLTRTWSSLLLPCAECCPSLPSRMHGSMRADGLLITQSDALLPCRGLRRGRRDIIWEDSIEVLLLLDGSGLRGSRAGRLYASIELSEACQERARLYARDSHGERCTAPGRHSTGGNNISQSSPHLHPTAHCSKPQITQQTPTAQKPPGSF